MRDEQADALTSWFQRTPAQREAVLANLRADYDEYRTDRPEHGNEDYPGESRERADSFRLAILALGGSLEW